MTALAMTASATAAELDERSRARALALRAGDGSGPAFAELVELYGDRLLAYLCRMGVIRHDAEDLVQEAFIRAWDAIARYDPRYAFSTWLYTIARRLACNFFRDQREVACLADGVPDLAAPAAVPDGGDLPPIWDLARAHLPARQFEAIWLFYGEDLSMKDLARVMGITAINAKVLVHRARRRLADHLAPLMEDDT